MQALYDQMVVLEKGTSEIPPRLTKLDSSMDMLQKFVAARWMWYGMMKICTYVFPRKQPDDTTLINALAPLHFAGPHPRPKTLDRGEDSKFTHRESIDIDRCVKPDSQQCAVHATLTVQT